MQRLSDDLIDFFWDLVFPPFCVACGAEGFWWCAACRGAVQLIPRPVCPGCASRKSEHVCPQRLGLDGLVVCGFYHDPKLRIALHALKYRGLERLTPEISDFLQTWHAARCGPWPWAGAAELAIQPLVGAPSSIRARGFDQAMILARLVKDVLVPWGSSLNVLTRHSSLLPQAKVAAGLRPANVANVFSVRRDMPLPPSVLLVDDVLTTGATMAEAAWVLRAAGVRQVFGFALALGA